MASTLNRLATRIVTLASIAPIASAQIFTENAGVASPERPAIREALRVFQTGNVTELRSDTQLIYSFTPAFETRLTLPVIWRDVDVPGAGGHALWAG